MEIDGDLVVHTVAVEVALTVPFELGVVPCTVAVSTIEPSSMSAWVTV